MPKVKSVEYAGRADVYNLEIEPTHNYIVCDGIVAKNCDSLRYLCDGRPSHRVMVPQEYDSQIDSFINYGG